MSRRSGFWWGVITVLFSALVIGACTSSHAPSPAGSTATIDHRAAFGFVQPPAQGGAIETPDRVILDYGAITAVYVPLLAPSTPTPIPTDTPTAPPTGTPTPSLTPTPQPTAPPTNTLRPTATETPVPEATATSEQGTPIPTLVTPVPTLPPPDEGCYGTVQVALTIRTGPATLVNGVPTSAPPTGTYWRADERVRIVQVVYVPSSPTRIDEWVHAYDATRDGWSAALFTGLEYITYDASDECRLVRFGTEQPGLKGVVALGFHDVPGANANNLKWGYALAAQISILASTKPYADSGLCVDAILMGADCIFRSPPGGQDNPNLLATDPRAEARRWMKLVKNSAWGVWEYRHSGRLWIEITNEAPFEWEYLYWWRDFYDEALEYARANDFPPLALPGLGPGWGDQEMFRIWAPMLKKLRDYNGLFSSHIYSYSAVNGLCVYNIWLADRHEYNHNWMVEYGYGDLRTALTEVARAEGNATVDVWDFACYWLRIRNQSWVHSVAYWTTGYHPQWPNANLDNYIVPITQEIARALQ